MSMMFPPDEKKLKQAKALFEAKQYDEAREILELIQHHPTARQLLVQVVEIERQKARKTQRIKSASSEQPSLPFAIQILLIAVVFLLIGGGIGYFLGRESLLAPLRELSSELEQWSSEFNFPTIEPFNFPTIEFPEIRFPAP